MTENRIPRKEELERVNEILAMAMQHESRAYDILQGMQDDLRITGRQRELLADARQYTLDARWHLTKAKNNVFTLLTEANPANEKKPGGPEGHPSEFAVGATSIGDALLVSIRPKDTSYLIRGKVAVVHFVPRQYEPQILDKFRNAQDIGSILDFLEKIAIKPSMSTLEKDIVEYWRQQNAEN